MTFSSKRWIAPAKPAQATVAHLVLRNSFLLSFWPLSLPVKKVINLLRVTQWHFRLQTQYSLFVFFSVHWSEFTHYLKSDSAGRLLFFLNSKFGIEFCRKKWYINSRKLSDVILYWNITKIMISYRKWEKMVACINFVIQFHPPYNIPFFLIFDEALNSLTIINIFTLINYHTAQY